MKIILLISLVGLCAAGFHHRTRLRRRAIRVVDGIIDDMLESNVNAEGVKFLIPGSVRLVFHDCISGCNGCINKNQKGNRGLESIITTMETYYQKPEVKNVMSRADFWVLTSLRALIMGVNINNAFCVNHPEIEDCTQPKFHIEFLSGRMDCDSSPYTDVEDDLPDSNMDSPAFNAWWRKNYDLTPNNGVSLMGLHTLGRVTHDYNGIWDVQLQDGVNNRYFVNIENKCNEWVQMPASNQSDAKFQWVGRNNTFALNVDMAQFLNFRIDMENNKLGQVSCQYHNCGHTSGTAGMLSQYANDAQNWANNVKHTFRHVVENGYRLHRV